VLRLLAALACVPALAQERPPSLSGTVVAAVSGKPIKRAEVILRPAVAGVTPLGVTTDEYGRFAFYNVPSGSYRLYALHDGYLPSTYVLYRNARLTQPFVLDKQSLDELTMRLPAAGVLSGKVRHNDAEPVSGAIVEAYRGFYDRGRFLYETAGRVLTNDRGEYRMYNLPPGRYHMAAIVSTFRSAPENFEESFPVDFTGARLSPERSVTTFFPNAWKLTEAAQFQLGSGAELSNMDITLARTKSAIVQGRAISALSGRLVRGASIVLVRPDAKDAGFLPARFQTKPLQDGTFEIRGVVPGTYYLEASASEERKQLHARQLLVVSETAEYRVEVLMRPEVILEGIVRSAGDRPVRLGSMRLTAEPRLELPSKTVSVVQDGSFKLPLLPGVEYNLVLAGAAGNAYLKSARLHGVDVLESRLMVTSPAQALLDVVVDDLGGRVRGWSQPGSTVLLMPQDGRIEKYQSTSANEYGVFDLPGVAPGDYRVLSWFDTPPCEVHDPVNRAACGSFGAKVSVAEGGLPTVEVDPSDRMVEGPATAGPVAQD
jgi:hypothetical protein